MPRLHVHVCACPIEGSSLLASYSLQLCFVAEISCYSLSVEWLYYTVTGLDAIRCCVAGLSCQLGSNEQWMKADVAFLLAEQRSAA